MILFLEHYVPADPQRVAELSATFDANMALGMFSEIMPMTYGDERLRFGQVFRVAAQKFPGQICVLANADIQFDYTARLLPGVVREKTLVTLTRWETDATPRMIGQYRDERFFSGSQDVWAFIGGELVGVGDAMPMGYIGCDQAICGEAMQAGYAVVNPALSIKTFHRHAVNAREPGGLSALGIYAYPELTTMSVTGRLVYHPWPEEQSDADNNA